MRYKVSSNVKLYFHTCYSTLYSNYAVLVNFSLIGGDPKVSLLLARIAKPLAGDGNGLLLLSGNELKNYIPDYSVSEKNENPF